jgi:hypothetical protein
VITHTLFLALVFTTMFTSGAELTQSTNTWVKRSPLPDTPPSPRLGYEGACVWDNAHRVVIRYGGHNQGGGGEQNAEVWTCDPATARWTLKEPNMSPPGICCGQQNVFDAARRNYVRFPSFSGSHGWQWWREIYLNDSSVWTYDLASNVWRNMRPLPTPRLAPLRCASWDSDNEVVIMFGGEGSREGTLIYDPYANTWAWPKPKAQPEFRSGGNMAYDAARKLHILFGSQFSDDPHTWAYDLKANEWRDLKPAAMPPTDKNDAVLTYDPINKVVLALAKISEGSDESAKHRLETWAFDAGVNSWTKMKPAREPDASGNRARNLMFAPELNLAILEDRPHPPGGLHEQQIWTYRYAEAKTSAPPPAPKSHPQPRIVEDIVVSVVSAKQVEIAWVPSSAQDVAGYHVERAPVEVLTEDQLKRLKKQTPPLAEPSVGAIKRIGQFKRLTSGPVREGKFTDATIDLSSREPNSGESIYERNFNAEQFDESGKPYRLAVFAYRVHAVNGRGTESGPSPAGFTIPSPPQWVFAKEEGTTCRLKWSANPEKGISGYRVYRMNGRYDKDAIVRLTGAPISGLAHSDPEAGKVARRYYVVAVDALGQEGFPSSPVWFEREWKRFYEPFTAEWHQ